MKNTARIIVLITAKDREKFNAIALEKGFSVSSLLRAFVKTEIKKAEKENSGGSSEQ